MTDVTSVPTAPEKDSIPQPKVKVVGNKDSLNDWIWDVTGGIVYSGPFKGMRLIKEESWKDGNLGNKCIGCYEQELHDIIEQEIERLSKIEHPKIANVGCAEGYYAVGLARRLPNAKVHAFDIEPSALRITAEAGELNGVGLYIGWPIKEIFTGVDLVVMDCEGSEIGYLDLLDFPDLMKATIIVECHEWPGRPVTDHLIARFNLSHYIWIAFTEGVRSPGTYEILNPLPSHAKWLAVSEGRPVMQPFLIMKPR